MRPLSLLAAVVAVAAAGIAIAGPARIGDIRFRGNREFGRKELLGNMRSAPGGAFSPADLANDLVLLAGSYAREGFLTSTVRIDSLTWSPDSSSVDIDIGIRESERAKTGRVGFEGNRALGSDTLGRMCETVQGKEFIPEALDRDMKLIVVAYGHAGYPFARADLRDLALSGDSAAPRVDILVGIDEGPKAVISEVRVSGNTDTKQSVIVRETGIRMNELFDEEKVGKIRARLSRLGLFSSVDEPQVFLTDSGAGLILTVHEKNPNTLDGIVGYVPSPAPGEAGFVVGAATISLRNLFGTARALDIRWQREEKGTQEVGFRYREPWLFDLPLALGFGFNQRQQDTAYVRRTMELSAGLTIGDAVTVAGTVAADEVIPSESAAPGTTPASSTVSTGLELRVDTRDDAQTPGSGIDYRSGYRIGKKRITGPTMLPGASVIQRLSLDAVVYVGTWSRQVVAVGLHGRSLTGANTDPADWYRFGGANTLRGFRENQFLAPGIAWLNTEYRFLLARTSWFFGFLDNGYISIPADQVHSVPAVQKTTYGFGFGFKVDTSIGNLGVSVALGEGDPIGQAKIHFGLLNDF